MNDKRVLSKLRAVEKQMRNQYPGFVESGIHGTSGCGVFYMVFRCAVTKHYLCFQWHIDNRKVRFSQVLSNLHADEAKEYSSSLYRLLKRIHKTFKAKGADHAATPTD